MSGFGIIYFMVVVDGDRILVLLFNGWSCIVNFFKWEKVFFVVVKIFVI